MQRIVELYEQKNHHLEKFYSLNEYEIKNMNEGNFQNLNTFYKHRDDILNIIKYIDSQICAEQAKTEMQFNDLNFKNKLKEQLKIKDEYVIRILDQDLSVLSLINAEKAVIMSEIYEVRKTKKAMSGYKTYVPNVKLDEEA